MRDTQGRPSHEGNEAEIFIIPILVGKFGILEGERNVFVNLGREGKVNTCCREEENL